MANDTAWRSHLDHAMAALQAIQRAAEQDPQGDGPAADPLMAALFALETCRAARSHVNDLIDALTARAVGHGANWAALGFRFDAYDE
ncbi:hypothetical protein [Dactylosporangium sp. CS-033363]|uniref:hypothetical protein n=1 Tax=Dactylosporangium sp. CS-033363 TaxID=3239935 RepID=UPI003D8A30F3